jgi:hypothetical protein
VSLRLPAIALVVVASSAGAASRPIQTSVEQLLAAPQRFHGKRVEVTGFFDSPDRGWELRQTAKHAPHRDWPIDNVIYIDFSDAQAQLIIGKQHFLKGYVHIIGRFEYSPPTPDVVHRTPRPKRPLRDGEVVRDIVTKWWGFGFGHPFQIAAITLFKPI